MLGTFPFTLPHELADGQRRRLRIADGSAWRAFLFGCYREADLGRGRWITVYASPSHVYMVVNGVRFDTSGRSGRQSRWQHDMRDPGGHVARHPPGL